MLSVSYDSLQSTTDSLIVVWTLAKLGVGVTVEYYTISYSNIYCPTDTYDDITDIGPSEIMYTITGLEEGIEYFITVTVTLNGRGTGEDTLTATTMTAG